ncbi:MAG: hypothetical protein R2750_12120 [Bacteroidales bacterium]
MTVSRDKSIRLIKEAYREKTLIGVVLELMPMLKNHD